MNAVEVLLNMKKSLKLVTTVKERCRVCYTCVRDCPAKAIRISGGQAEVIEERCIGCGNCILVCSREAKQPYDSIPEVHDLLNGTHQVAAIVAPSFPASFPDVDERRLVGVLKKMGFHWVLETAFGADMTAAAYGRLIESEGKDGNIGTTCPAIVSYIQKYHPDLVKRLAPIASPMIAAARYLHRVHGRNLKIVFIGPCLAKKAEAATVGGGTDVDAALTFIELKKMMAKAGLAFDSDDVTPCDFDPPHPSLGMLFPLSRGILQAAGTHEDLLAGRVVAADGRSQFIQAVKEFEIGALSCRLLEILCCNGCIMGPGMSCDTPLFRRRSQVSDRARRRLEQVSFGTEPSPVLSDNELFVSFSPDDQRNPFPSDDKVEEILLKLGKSDPEDELNCGACGYETCRAHATAILNGLAESEMCLPFVIDQLKDSLHELNLSNSQLASTQQALINAEKLASMGQLSAGIAHEINNPLGVILLYTKLLLDDLPKEAEQRPDLTMIMEQAERCKTIVSGLLNFARQRKLALRPTNICQLVDHNLHAIIIPQHIALKVEHLVSDPWIELDPDQIVQVITNLVINAVEAMTDGGEIRVSTEDDKDFVKILVADNGPGIPKELQKKIFEPFFTTKQIGKGTGLGLAVTYGIVKMHMGQIDVVSPDPKAALKKGSTFVVSLPKKRREAHVDEGMKP
jgi:signal transduction histidine kinase/iron only hydrogenase large subunit-like protein